MRRLALSLVALLFLAGPAPAEGFVLRTTTQMLAQPLAFIFEGQAEVTSLLGAGTDPHTYQPTRSDVRSLVEADAVTYHGLLFEAQLLDLMQQLDRRLPALSAEAYQPADDLLRDGGLPDPHTWHNPVLWIETVVGVSRALEEQTDLELSQARVTMLREAALQTDAWIQDVFAGIDPERRTVVSAHDAFQYYGERYGVRFEPVLGLSTASETKLARLNELVDLIEAQDLSAVFSETTVENAGIAALREGAARRGLELRALPPLFSDALAPAGEPGSTYFGMLIQNTINMADAMTGQRPAPPATLLDFLGRNGLISPTATEATAQ